jgi:hypothetical protein
MEVSMNIIKFCVVESGYVDRVFLQGECRVMAAWLVVVNNYLRPVCVEVNVDFLGIGFGIGAHFMGIELRLCAGGDSGLWEFLMCWELNELHSVLLVRTEMCICYVIGSFTWQRKGHLVCR